MSELESVKILKQRGVEYRLIELEEKAISVEDVIRYSKTKIEPGEICKTIILKDRKGKKYAVFLLGNMKIDFNKAKRVIGSKVSVASFDEVIDATGVTPGAVCPLTLKIPLLIDRGVMSRERINFGSGNHIYGLEIQTQDLMKIINYQLVDVAA